MIKFLLNHLPICLNPPSTLYAICFWAIVVFLCPTREAVIPALGGLAFTLAYIQWHARNAQTRIFLLTRPGWKKLSSETAWTSYLCLGSSFTIIYFLKTSITDALHEDYLDSVRRSIDINSMDSIRVAISALKHSWHWTLLPYFVFIYTGFKLFFSRFRSLGVLVIACSAFIPSIPDIHLSIFLFEGRRTGPTFDEISLQETFLWQTAGYWTWLIISLLLALILFHALAKYFILKKVNPGHMIHRLIGNAFGSYSWSQVLLLALCFIWLGFLFRSGKITWINPINFPRPLVLLFYRTSSFFHFHLTGMLGVLWLFSLVQFKNAAAKAGSEYFYITRPCKAGQGTAANIRHFFAGAYGRIVVAAILVESVFTWQYLAGHPSKGIPFTLHAVRVLATVSVVSLAFLAMVFTWWTVRREGEKLFACYLIHGLLIFGSNIYIWHINTCTVFQTLGIMVALNLLLLTCCRLASRRPPVYRTHFFRVTWLFFIIAFVSGLFWLRERESCLRILEVLRFTLLHGGYPAFLWMSVIAFSFFFTLREGIRTCHKRSVLLARIGRKRSVVLTCIALSLVIPFLGYWLLYMTRPRICWLRQKERFGIVPRLLVPPLTICLVLLLHVQDWRRYVICEAYVHGPSQLADRIFIPGKKENEPVFNFYRKSPPKNTGIEIESPVDKIEDILGKDPDNDTAIAECYRIFGSNTIYLFNDYIEKRHSHLKDPWELLKAHSLLSDIPFHGKTMARFTGLFEAIAKAEGLDLPWVNKTTDFAMFLYGGHWKEHEIAWGHLIRIYFWLKVKEDPAGFMAAFKMGIEHNYAFKHHDYHTNAYPKGFALECIARLGLDLDDFLTDKESFIALLFIDCNERWPYSFKDFSFYYLFRQVDAQFRKQLENVLDKHRESTFYTPSKFDNDARFLSIHEIIWFGFPEWAAWGSESFRRVIDTFLPRFGRDHWIQYSEYSPSFEIIEQQLKKSNATYANMYGDKQSTQRFWGLAAALCWPDASILDTVEAHWDIILHQDLSQQQENMQLLGDYGEKVTRFVEAAARKWPDDPRPKKWLSDVQRIF